MPSRLLEFSDQMGNMLLRAYPADFRERFAAEMTQVFRCLCRETYQKSGAGALMSLWLSAIWDLSWAAVDQWRIYLFKPRREIMPAKLTDRQDEIEPLTSAQAWIAALPFLAFGIASLASRMDVLRTTPVSLPVWQILLIHPYFLFDWFVLIGLGAGILSGFPRWAYSFLGWAFLFGWWWTGTGFYGHRMDWKIWLPVLGVILIALLIWRSLRPLRTMLAGLWLDLTLLAFGIYILYGQTYMLYDENHHPYLAVFIIATTMVISLGAWAYFRSKYPLRRVLALVVGLSLATVLSVISYTTWDRRTYYGLPENGSNDILVGLVFITVMTILMFGIGYLARWRLLHRSRPKEI